MEHQNQDKISHPRFENLNGLRFIGALAVFLFHCFSLGNETWGDFYSSGEFRVMAKIMNKGHYGVNLFFVLSGFLITYLLLAEARQKGKINAYGFFMRRLLRIWPVFFIVIIFGFFIFPHLPYGIQTINSPVYYSLFMSNLEEIWHGWNDSVSLLTITWSVSIEEQFYMAWVAIMVILPPIRKGKFFFWYFTLLIAINLFFRYQHLGDERVLYFHTLSVMSDIAIGGYLGYICFKTKLLETAKYLPQFAISSLSIAGLGLVALSTLLFKGDLVLIQRLVVGLVFAFIVFYQAFGVNTFVKVDRLPGFYKLGEISYGLYMYHCIVIYYVQQIFSDLGWTDSQIGFYGYIILSALLTYAIAKLSYVYVEKPLLRLKKHFR